MSSLVTGNWRRLADHIKAARVALGYASQSQLADAAGVAEGSVRSLESGKPYTRMPVVTPRIEAALGWAPGTCRRIVEGEDPFSDGVFSAWANPPMTEEQKQHFRNLAAHLSPAVREQVLAEIDATPQKD